MHLFYPLLILCILLPNNLASKRVIRNINEIDSGHDHNHHHQHLDGDDPDFTGIMDFSNAEPGPGGSWCITKTSHVDHLVKDDIKECWHQNVTQCHDTYVTEFVPSQEQKCEETFWKSCKIDFRDMPYNYTMKQCHTPLVKSCDPSSYSKPEIVCKTWFESECNTTYTETTPNVEDRPNTWCSKVPRKICAPDNCKMVPGKEQCTDKMLVDTVQKPTEICDLQPQQHCKLITKLTPHLLSKEVCGDIPKEVCHLALSAPKNISKPMTLKWCTRRKEDNNQARLPHTANTYLPPPPSRSDKPPSNSYLPPPPNRNNHPSTNALPTYGSPTNRPYQNLQVRSDEDIPPLPSNLRVTKFPPQIAKSPEIHNHEEAFQPVDQEHFLPAASERQSQSIQLPNVLNEQLNVVNLQKNDVVKGPEITAPEVKIPEIKDAESKIPVIKDLGPIALQPLAPGTNNVPEVKGVDAIKKDELPTIKPQVSQHEEQFGNDDHEKSSLVSNLSPVSVTDDLTGGGEGSFVSHGEFADVGNVPGSLFR